MLSAHGHSVTTPLFTVPCEGREAGFLLHSHQESNPGSSHGSLLHNHCATPAPACNSARSVGNPKRTFFYAFKVLYGYVTLCCVYDQGVESIGWSVWSVRHEPGPAASYAPAAATGGPRQDLPVDRWAGQPWHARKCSARTQVSPRAASPDTRENALLELRSVPCQPRHTRKCSARTQVSPLPAPTHAKMLC